MSFWGSSEFYANILGSRDSDESSELELLVHAYLRDAHYTSRRSAIMNVIYSTFNVGLVALPLVAEHSGLPLFIFGIVLVAMSTGYTTCMVINMASEQGVRTLEDLCERAFGIRGFIGVSMLQIVFSVSLMCITLDVWADIVSSVLTSYDGVPSQLKHRYFGLIVGSALVLPFCLFARSMSSLKWSSYGSVIAIITALFCIVAAVACDEGDRSHIKDLNITEVLAPKRYWWIISLVITFCFSNNQKVFTVYQCLRRRSTERWAFVVQRSHFVIAAFYICFGAFGYISNVKQDRLSNIDYFLEFNDATSKISLLYFNILSGVVALSLLFTVPVDCLVAATTCRRLYSKYLKNKVDFCACSSKEEDEDEDAYSPQQPSLLNGLVKRKSCRCTSANCCCAVEQGAAVSAADAASATRQSESFRIGSTTTDFTADGSVATSTTTAPVAIPTIRASPKSMGKSIGHDRSTFSSDQGLTSSGTGSLTTSEGRSSLVDSTGTRPPADRSSWSKTEVAVIQEGGEEDTHIVGEGLRHTNNLSETSEILVSLVSGAMLRDSATTSYSKISPVPEDDDDAEPLYSHSNLDHDDSPGADSHAATNSLYRQSSLEAVMNKPIATSFSDVVPALGLWALTVGLCFSYANFGMLGILLGPIATVFLVYICPSMIYFRLGLGSDFQAIPFLGFIPNQLYMLIIQFLGLVFLLCNLAAFFYSCFADQVMITF